MKKYLAFILMFSLLFSFNACSSDSDDDGEEVDDFSWKGDWNDEDNDNYNGYYNPIQGDWHSINNTNIRVIFNKDFSIDRKLLNSETEIWTEYPWAKDYQINDIGIKYISIGEFTDTYNEYKFVNENGQRILYMRYTLPSDDGSWHPLEWMKYKRYTEK